MSETLAERAARLMSEGAAAWGRGYADRLERALFDPLQNRAGTPQTGPRQFRRSRNDEGAIMYGESPKSPEFADVCTRMQASIERSGRAGIAPAYELEDAAADYARGNRWQLLAALQHSVLGSRDVKIDRQLVNAFCAGAEWGADQVIEIERAHRFRAGLRLVASILVAGAGLAAIVLMVLR